MSGESGETSLHLGRARQGDADSLEWLVERLSPLLLAQARYRLGGRMRQACDPEDLVQETWAIGLPRLATLEDRDGRGTPVLVRFLGQTLLNLSNNLMRKAARRGLQLGDADLEVDSSLGGLEQQVADSITGALTRLGRGESLAQMHAALEELDPVDREVLILRGIEGQTAKTVAVLLGVEANTVSKRYSRALEKLRMKMPESPWAELD